MKSFEYYSQIDIEYPKSIGKPILKITLIADDYRKYADALEEYELAKEKREEKLLVYNNRKQELEGEFKKDALEDVGLTDHPAANKAWNFAWEEGHSSGMYSVYSFLERIAEVIL